ncbi:hypothetical protein JCGZ_23471 [Jatropha curcas]|uniref:Uncharacterized protein n=1 Tax=Jatropha curcas TaxID=180498 RepID=A0A067JLD5_JATCU|nr:hypothetical protein JCGZ_23471 [Jatropha curcas]
MSEQCLVIDAWIREAQEVSILVEDIESRIKNKNLELELELGHRLKEIAKSKLFEVGIKLDRLESLLHNPPSKPILTKEDVEFRWEMLSDFRSRTRVLALSVYSSPSTKRTKEDVEFRWEMLSDFRSRTRVLALSVYSSPSTKRAGGLPVTNTKGSNEPCKSDDQDHMNSFSKDDSEMLKPLISKDATQSHELQMKQSVSCIPMSGINKVCWIICLILGAAALLVLLDISVNSIFMGRLSSLATRPLSPLRLPALPLMQYLLLHVTLRVCAIASLSPFPIYEHFIYDSYCKNLLYIKETKETMAMTPSITNRTNHQAILTCQVLESIEGLSLFILSYQPVLLFYALKKTIKIEIKDDTVLQICRDREQQTSLSLV